MRWATTQAACCRIAGPEATGQRSPKKILKIAATWGDAAPTGMAATADAPRRDYFKPDFFNGITPIRPLLLGPYDSVQAGNSRFSCMHSCTADAHRKTCCEPAGGPAVRRISGMPQTG
jgi:hypothetical protein